MATLCHKDNWRRLAGMVAVILAVHVPTLCHAQQLTTTESDQIVSGW
jgi:hypothetical protein